MTPSILMVDDDENYPKLLTEAFRSAKIPGKFTWLEDGESAWAHLEEKIKGSAFNELPNLILLDINMPGMNGFEFLRLVRKNENLQALPVVMLSVSESPHDVRHSYFMGANAYITKPTDFDQMEGMFRAIYQFWFQYAKILR